MSDHTRELQVFVDSIRAGRQSTRPINPGRYVLTDTLQVGRSHGLRLTGGGQVRSPNISARDSGCAVIFDYQGPPDRPAVEFSGCRGLVWEGINVLANKAAQGILIRHGEGSLNIALRDFGIMGGVVGIQCGVEAGEPSCANVTYDNLHWQGQKEACVRLMNDQSVEHLFLRPTFTWGAVAIDPQHGGAIAVKGGGSYEMVELLRLGKGGRNVRGFSFEDFRIDGKGTRTAWLTASDVTKTRTAGQVCFDKVQQMNAQLNSELPVLSVPPGCRAVVSRCSFDGNMDNLARVYADAEARGELYIEKCDGLEGPNLQKYVTFQGSGGMASIKDTGTIYGPTGEWSHVEP